MNVEQLREICLSFPHATEDLPFDEWTLCFKVAGKIFAITSLNAPELSINLKCDPDKAIELREKYEDVSPGYHMNKNHWNTVKCIGSVPDHCVKEWIADSYNLVCKGLPARIKKELDL